MGSVYEKFLKTTNGTSSDTRTYSKSDSNSADGSVYTKWKEYKKGKYAISGFDEVENNRKQEQAYTQAIALANQEYQKRSGNTLTYGVDGQGNAGNNTTTSTSNYQHKKGANVAEDYFNGITENNVGSAIVQLGKKFFGSGESVKVQNETKTNDFGKLDTNTQNLVNQYVEAKKNADTLRNSNVMQGNGSIDFTTQSKFDNQVTEIQKQLKASGLSDEQITEYADTASRLKNQKAAETTASDIKETIKKNPGAAIGYNVLDVASSIGQGYSSTLDAITNRALGTQTDTNSDAWGWTNFSNAVQEGTQEANTDYWDKKYGEGSWQGKAANFAYGVLSSTAKSMEAMAFGGVVSSGLGLGEKATQAVGNLITLPSFGATAFSDTLEDSLDKGLNENQAYTLAFVSGVAEMATEVFSLDKAWDIYKNAGSKAAKNALVNALVEAGIEGSEEAASDVINGIADYMISGDLSDYAQNVAYYQTPEGGGLSEEEAKKKANWDFIKQVTSDFAAGALSGGIAGTVATGAGIINNSRIGKFYSGSDTRADSLISDENSPNYISHDRADYKSDEDYQQAQDTIEQIIADSDTQVTGKEARSLGKNITEAVTNSQSGQTLNRIQAAQNPTELKTIYEEGRLTDEQQKAYDQKKAEMLSNGATQADFDTAVTPEKAYQMAKNGELTSDDIAKLEDVNAQKKARMGLLEAPTNVRNYDVTTALVDGKQEKLTGEVTQDGDKILFTTENGNKVELTKDNTTALGNIFFNGNGRVEGVTSLDSPELMSIAMEAAISSDGKIPYSSVVNAVNTMNTLGRSGASFEAAIQSATIKNSGIKTEILRKAYNLNTNEAKDADVSKDVSKTPTKVGKGTGKYVSKESEELAKNLNPSNKKLIEALSKKIGLDIELFDGEVGSGATRGQYSIADGVIRLNVNYQSQLFSVAIHEGIGEFLQAHNAKGYNDIAQTVINYWAKGGAGELAEQARDYVKAYRKAGEKNKSYREGTNELFNDILGTIFSTEEGVKNMADWLAANESKSKVQKVVDVLTDYLNMIKDALIGARVSRPKGLRMTEEEIDKLTKDLLSAMDTAIANRDAQVGQSAESNNDGVERSALSIDEMQNLSVEDKNNYKFFKHQIDLLTKGYFANTQGSVLVMKNTPEILQLIGMDNLPIYTQANHLAKALKADDSKRHLHGLSQQELSEAPILLANPAMIADSISKNGSTSIVVISNSLDNQNRPIILAIKTDGEGKVNFDTVDSNFLTSTYGKDRFSNFIDNIGKANAMLYMDKQKTQDLLVGLRLQLPTSLTNLAFDDIIHPSNNIVNRKSISVDTSEGERNSVEIDSDYAPVFYSKMEREIEAIKQPKMGAASVVSYLKGKGVKADEIKWSGIETFLEGKKSVTRDDLLDFARSNQIRIVEDTLDQSSANQFDKLTEMLDDLNIPYSYEDWINPMDDEFDFDAFMTDMREYLDSGDLRTQDFAELLSQAQRINQEDSTRWSEYTTRGTTNYRELLFKLPNSDYTNSAMQTHWGEKGVLAHARIDDLDLPDGSKMLFVEEIQSDWHNATAKNPTKENTHITKTTAASGRNLYYLLSNKNLDEITRVTSREIDEHNLSEDINSIQEYALSKASAPDAPFKNTYTDYVMKRLLRMAAEGDYDYIGWTTGRMQEERWSDKYAEGYRIEYDQEIPKFMSKYGKQWGAKVEDVAIEETHGSTVDSMDELRMQNISKRIADETGIDLKTVEDYIIRHENTDSENDIKIMDSLLDNGLVVNVSKYWNKLNPQARKVHSVQITPSMKQSVLYEGQARFSVSIESDEDLLNAFKDDNQEAIEKYVGGKLVTKEDVGRNSRALDEKLMDAAFRYNSKHDGFVNPLVLSQAKSARTIAKNYLDKYSYLLPEDNAGNVIEKNGSYGKTVENSLVCIRSIISGNFMDAVSEKLGRPLTVEQQLVASQILAEITGDQRECSYCYVATDRRTYRAFFNNYFDQYQEVYDKVQKNPQPFKENKMYEYQEFLNGRDDTDPMKKRYKLFVEDALSGTQSISRSDLTTAVKRSLLSRGNSRKAQLIRDAEKYCKGAAWPKNTERTIKINGQNHKVQYAAYNGNILNFTQDLVNRLNADFGLRMYSYSDYVPAFLLENMQEVTDASVRGLKMLAYTKDVGFAKVFAPTGMGINISIFGGTEDGKVYQDGMMGADWEEAKALREQFDNVGTVFVATNDELVEWALAQDWIDVVIPYHLVRTGTEVAEHFGYTNYKAIQEDKKVKGLWNKDKDLKSIPPTIHANNKETYLKALAENHLKPRFEKWIDNPNYMKLVNETRMAYTDMSPVQPLFDMDAVNSELARIPVEGSYGMLKGMTDAGTQNEVLSDYVDRATEEVRRMSIEIADRYSIKLLNESPYSNAIKESEVISSILSAANKALKGHNLGIGLDIEAVGDKLLKKYKSQMDREEFMRRIMGVMYYMQDDDYVDYDTVVNYTLSLADELLASSTDKDPDDVAREQSFRDILSGYTIKVSDAQKKELLNYFDSWAEARRAIIKTGLKVSDEGTDIDSVYSEIVDATMVGVGYFLDPTPSSQDEIREILDASNALEARPISEVHGNSMDRSLVVATDILTEYFRTAQVEVEKNIASNSKEGKAAIKQVTNKLIEQDKKYRKQLEDDYNERVDAFLMQADYYQRQAKAAQESEAVARRVAKKLSKNANVQSVETAKRIARGFQDKYDQIKRRTAELNAKAAADSVGAYKEAQEKAHQIEEIKKIGNRLINWSIHPTDKQHIPSTLAEPVEQFLSAIDFLPQKAKADSKNTKRWQDKMRSLEEVLRKIENIDTNTNGMSYEEVKILNDLSWTMHATELLDLMEDVLQRNDGKLKVSNLSADDLKKLHKVLSGLSAAINNINKSFANERYQNIDAAAQDTIAQMKEQETQKDASRLGEVMRKFLNLDEIEPLTYFESMGDSATSIFKELRKGFDTKVRRINQSDEYMQAQKEKLGITDSKISQWKKQHYTFNLADGEIQLNANQIMALYETQKRAQGKAHVYQGGIKSGKTQIKLKFHRDVKPIHVTADEVMEMASKLTPEQIALADAMQEYMATECSAWGNTVATRMYGYDKFTEPDYFPLRTDSNSNATTVMSDIGNTLRSIQNSGFTKSIVSGANNALVIDDIFDIFTNHVVDMANYEAFVMPIADAMRWYNYSETYINGHRRDTTSLKEEIDRVMGEEGKTYFTQFIKDINGDRAGSGGGFAASDFFMSSYKAQAVGANLRVIMQQPIAMLRALNVIDSKYLLGASLSFVQAKKYAEKAQKNSMIASWKSRGYYDTLLGESLKQIITGDYTLRDKIQEITGKGAGLADDLTWGIMYKAAELKVSSETDLEYDSEEYTKKVVEVFEDIVDHTQVVDTVFHKSMIMKSQNGAVKMATAFMAEPTKTYNVLYRAFMSARRDKDYGKLATALFAFFTEQIVTAAVTALIDALRSDDGDDYTEKYIEYLKENSLSNINPLNLFPLFKELESYKNGFDPTRYDTQWIGTLYDTYSSFVKYFNGTSNKTTYGMLYQVAKAMSQISGMPIANTLREVKTINNIFTDNDWYAKTDDAESAEKAAQKEEISKAFATNDLTTIKKEMQSIYDSEIAAGKDESDAWSTVRSTLKEQYQAQIAEEGAQLTTINNRFKTLLRQTKKANGKGGYRALTDKEIKNYIEGWSKAED